MKHFITLLFIISVQIITFGQEKFEDRVKNIKRNIELVKTEEKEALRTKVEEINLQLEKNEITQSQADEMKKAEAEKSAEKLTMRIEPFEAELLELIKSEVNAENKSESNPDTRATTLDDEDVHEDKGDTSENRPSKRSRTSYENSERDRRFSRSRRRGEPVTTTQFVFAMGLNNLITDHDFGSLEDNGLKLSNSRFYEWGWTWKTRLVPHSPFLNLKYGFSFTYNNLRPADNQYYIKDGKKTLLAPHPYSLTDEPYFRMKNFVLPVHFELDFSKTNHNKSDEREDEKIVVRTQRSVRVGIGGYVGINYRTKQILEYKNDGHHTDQITRGDYNTNDIIYGLSCYVGYKDFSLYSKYDLNTIFTNNPLKQHNISVGARFDFH